MLINYRRATRLRTGGDAVRTGGLGIGTIILLGLVGWALGINPLYLIGGAEILSRLGGSSSQQTQPAPASPAADDDVVNLDTTQQLLQSGR